MVANFILSSAKAVMLIVLFWVWTFCAFAAFPILQLPAYCKSGYLSCASPSCNLIQSLFCVFCGKKKELNYILVRPSTDFCTVFLFLDWNVFEEWYCMIPDGKMYFFIKWTMEQHAKCSIYLFQWEKCWFLKTLDFIGQKWILHCLHNQKQGASDSRETAWWCKLSSPPKSKWPYQMMARDGQWQPLSGNNENLSTFSSPSA